MIQRITVASTWRWINNQFRTQFNIDHPYLACGVDPMPDTVADGDPVVIISTVDYQSYRGLIDANATIISAVELIVSLPEE